MLPKEESETVELKGSMPKGSIEIAKEIVAFANTNGGVVYLGIQDKTAKILGIKNTQKLKDKITNKEYRELVDVSANTAYRDLLYLVNKKIIKLKGKGRSTHYILIKSKDKSDDKSDDYSDEKE